MPKTAGNPRDDLFIGRIVTCDEKWVYFNNPDKQNQWLNQGQIAEPVAKRDLFSKNASGGILIVQLTINLFQTIVLSTADLFCAELDLI